MPAQTDKEINSHAHEVHVLQVIYYDSVSFWCKSVAERTIQPPRACFRATWGEVGASCSATWCEFDQHHGESMELILGLTNWTHDIRASPLLKSCFESCLSQSRRIVFSIHHQTLKISRGHRHSEARGERVKSPCCPLPAYSLRIKIKP